MVQSRRSGPLATGLDVTSAVWLTVSLAATLVLFAGTASAHEVGGSRFDAPIPLAFLFVGAGLTVGVTALWLGVDERTPEALGMRRRLATVPRSIGDAVRSTARAAFLVLVVVSLVHGLLGRQIPAENVATLFVWPVWLKGVGVVAILAGSPWSTLSPWRTLYDVLTGLEGREIALLGGYPSWLGAWPALVGFVVGVGIVENLTAVPRSPRLTVVVVAGYTLLMLLGGVAFGRDWFRHADTLAVLYELLGRVAPVDASRTNPRGYDVEVRPPWEGSTAPVSSLALVGFVVATVYTVSFDGFTSTPEYQTLRFAARGLAGPGRAAEVALYLVGLAGFVASFLLVAGLVRALATGGPDGWRHTARAFAPTVVPIAAAYELAHNYPFVIRSAAQLLTVASDLLFGPTGVTLAPLESLSLPLFWGSQVLLIVAGHLVAVVAAHVVAVRRFDSFRAARRGHLPLVVLMVGYTVLSLWIVSRPIVS